MPPSARLIDLTRLVSRLGKGPLTGVDRVELAYLSHLLGVETPLFALVRSALGFVLLDRQGARAVEQRATGRTQPGQADLIGWLTWRDDPARAQAEADLRKLAVSRCISPRLGAMLRQHMPRGFSYLNLGHANLSGMMMKSLRKGGVGQIAVLVHDTIPLDHPEFTRPGIGAVFERKIAAVACHADLVIHSAEVTRRKTEAHFAKAGRIPTGIVAPLGVTVAAPGTVVRPKAPYFVTVGTIEPRKNHALLLDVWEAMHATLDPATIPHLLVLGTRGWANEAVFNRLDTLPFIGQTVFERPGLPDDQVAGLMAGACALLFPSLAEGYGLPPLEAACLGVPVVLPELAIYRETLDNYPLYQKATDCNSWLETIAKLSIRMYDCKKTNKGGLGGRPERKIPSWSDHLNTVLELV